jgi:hypothetical protein
MTMTGVPPKEVSHCYSIVAHMEYMNWAISDVVPQLPSKCFVLKFSGCAPRQFEEVKWRKALEMRRW